MDLLVSTAILYGLVGLCIATALVLREDRRSVSHRALGFIAGAAFWPLFAPMLLGAGAERQPPGRTTTTSAFAPRIRAAEEQLLTAIGHGEGIAEEVLGAEVARVRAVAGQMASMERRVHEMDELLRTPEFDAESARIALGDLSARGVSPDDPRVQSVRARLRNIERLRSMRDRTCADLERIILKLEEMSSRLRLLRFAGRPDAEVVQLIKEVAESVEEVTEGLLEAH